MQIDMLEKLKIDGNLNKPSVRFDAQSGVLVLEGRSIIENTIRFYEPVVTWLNTYLENPAKETALHVKLEYFNTSTSKYLLTMIDKIGKLMDEGFEVMVYWYYGDEDMLDLGDDYQNMLDAPFTMIAHNFS